MPRDNIPSVVLNVHQGIAAQEEHKANARQLALLYMEWGFKACERGLNLEGAMIEFNKIQAGK